MTRTTFILKIMIVKTTLFLRNMTRMNSGFNASCANLVRIVLVGVQFKLGIDPVETTFALSIYSPF